MAAAKFNESISLRLEGRSIGLASNSGNLFVVRQDSGLNVINKNNLSLQSYLGVEGLNSVDTHGEIVIAKSWSNGIYGLDVDSTSGNIGIKWTINKPPVEGHMQVDGGYLYQGYWKDGVDIYKLSQGNNDPELIGNWKHWSWCNTTGTLSIDSNRLLVGHGGNVGHRIVDISNPRSPIVQEARDWKKGTWHEGKFGGNAVTVVAWNGDNVYLKYASLHSIDVWDLSEWGNPKNLGSLLPNLGASEIEFEGDKMYIAANYRHPTLDRNKNEGGIYQYDISGRQILFYSEVGTQM